MSLTHSIASRSPSPKSPTDRTDWELVLRTREGDLAAFELIMRRHNQRLYRIARSVLKNSSDAEDAVQEAYLTAYSKLEMFNGPDGFPSWLGKIVLNEALGRRRSSARIISFEDCKRNRPSEAAPAFIDTVQTPDPDPERLVMCAQLRGLLVTAIDNLPDNFRTVFVLRLVEGMSIEETATLLSIAPETVKTRLHRARRRLQHSLGESFEDLSLNIHQFAGKQCNRIVASVLSRIAAFGPPGRTGLPYCP